MPIVQAPSREKLAKAQKIVHSYTAKDLGITLVEKTLKGFVVTDDAMKTLLKTATSMSTVDTNAARRLATQLESVQSCDEQGDAMLEVQAGNEVSLVKIAVVCRKSETSANANAKDIAIRFAVLKFQRSDPWYSRLTRWAQGGPSVKDEQELKNAVEVICTWELSKMRK